MTIKNIRVRNTGEEKWCYPWIIEDKLDDGSYYQINVKEDRNGIWSQTTKDFRASNSWSAIYETRKEAQGVLRMIKNTKNKLVAEITAVEGRAKETARRIDENKEKNYERQKKRKFNKEVKYIRENTEGAIRIASEKGEHRIELTDISIDGWEADAKAALVVGKEWEQKGFELQTHYSSGRGEGPDINTVSLHWE